MKQIALLAIAGVLAGCSGSGGNSSTGDVSCAASGVTDVCVTTENGGYNGLGTHRFARFSVSATGGVSISARCVSGAGTDPDLVLYRNGKMVVFGNSTSLNQESLTVSLEPGDYVLELYDFNHYYSDTLNTSCYDIGIQSSVVPKTEPVVQAATEKTLPAVMVQALPSTCDTTGEITVSGAVTYDRVPHQANHSLNYAAITQEPVRGAVVELICTTDNQVYDSVTTDLNGSYVLNAPNNINSIVRVKAQLYEAGRWNFRVEDNTNANALYVMDSAVFSSAANITGKDLNAASGWDTNAAAYTSTRVAAPFAILDSVYVAMHKVLLADAAAVFPDLNLNWSVNNVAVPGSVAVGNITTSHYDQRESEIYILGDADDDTDEYDDHVIIHEWAHYFEHRFSRADNIGGQHGLSDILDIRVAFGEGWGNAFSAMASDDSIYSDASGVDQASGFGFDLEWNNCTSAGWYSECSVQSILYDLYDAVNDGADNLSLGFTPIYSVLVNEEKNTAALTSIFSFITPLKINNAESSAAIDDLLAGQNIDTITDIYGDSQISNNPGTVNQLPIYLQF